LWQNLHSDIFGEIEHKILSSFSLFSTIFAHPQYEELLAIAGLFDDPSPGYNNGFILGGERFTVLRIDEEMLHGKAKPTRTKTNQALTNFATIYSYNFFHCVLLRAILLVRLPFKKQHKL